jgi:acylphosphatase
MRRVSGAVSGVLGAAIGLVLFGGALSIAQTEKDAAAGAEKEKGVVTNAAPAVADATNAVKRVHAFVSGKVQGVGFRAFTNTSANALKLRGWVKNLKDGRVELVAEGPAADLEKLVAAVSKGPPGARVDKVEQKEEPPTGEFKGFRIEN